MPHAPVMTVITTPDWFGILTLSDELARCC